MQTIVSYPKVKNSRTNIVIQEMERGKERMCQKIEDKIDLTKFLSIHVFKTNSINQKSKQETSCKLEVDFVGHIK